MTHISNEHMPPPLVEAAREAGEAIRYVLTWIEGCQEEWDAECAKRLRDADAKLTDELVRSGDA